MTAPDPIPADLRDALDPTPEEIAGIMAEADAFRLPAPPSSSGQGDKPKLKWQEG